MAEGGKERIPSCIRGYHIYKTVWEATVGEELQCIREPTNISDRYAISVIKEGIVIGHLPKRLSRVCSLFLRHGGNIVCVVTGRRRYSRDLIQGGLEIPCILIMKGEKKELDKVKQLIR